jgi:hypothetical protein
MTYVELTDKLLEFRVFDASEILGVLAGCGTASIRNAVISAEIMGLELHGCNIKVMYSI